MRPPRGLRTILTVILLLGSTIALSQPALVRVTNDLKFARPASVISIPWPTLRSMVPSLTPDNAIVRSLPVQSVLPSQIVDVNGDGIPEELLVQCDVGPEEAILLEVLPGAAGMAKAPTKTDARFVEPRQDLAWENDRIAFRMYGPALAKEVSNGIDVWVKRVRYPIVAKWYAAAAAVPPGSKDPYHEDHGEGADFFDVGRSLGCGSCALMVGDSLLQPGVFEKYRILTTGPIRASFELTYAPVSIHGAQVAQTFRVTLDAGRSLNRIDVSFTPSAASRTVAAGLVKRKSVSASMDSAAHAGSLYGPTNADTTNQYLGTGVVMPWSFVGFRDTPSQLLVIGRTTPEGTLTYFAGAAWTRSGDVRSEPEWAAELNRCVAEARSPLSVAVMNAPVSGGTNPRR